MTGLFLQLVIMLYLLPTQAGDWRIVKGTFAEHCVRGFLAHEGWTKLVTAIGPHGIDYLGVQLRSGKVIDAIAVEIKGYADASARADSRGILQGSNKYNVDRIDRYIKESLDPIIASGGDAAEQAKVDRVKYLQARSLPSVESCSPAGMSHNWQPARRCPSNTCASPQIERYQKSIPAPL